MNINKINPSTLKITDMRFADIDGAPKRCTLMKLYTNQGLVGCGEVRDASSRTYAEMLKSRILGENPCNVEKVFRRIKQFGGDSRQAGGVCAVELACWDLCGKAWGVPCWQLMGGKWRDEIRCYCDTDSEGGGRDMGKALVERMKKNPQTEAYRKTAECQALIEKIKPLDMQLIYKAKSGLNKSRRQNATVHAYDLTAAINPIGNLFNKRY